MHMVSHVLVKVLYLRAVLLSQLSLRRFQFNSPQTHDNEVYDDTLMMLTRRVGKRKKVQAYLICSQSPRRRVRQMVSYSLLVYTYARKNLSRIPMELFYYIKRRI